MFKYLLFIVVVFSGCHNVKETQRNTIIFSEFPREENIVFKNVFKFEKGVVSRIYLRDTSLIVYDWRGMNGYFFYDYSLRTKQNIGKYMPHGRGRGKVLGLFRQVYTMIIYGCMILFLIK